MPNSNLYPLPPTIVRPSGSLIPAVQPSLQQVLALPAAALQAAETAQAKKANVLQRLRARFRKSTK